MYQQLLFMIVCFLCLIPSVQGQETLVDALNREPASALAADIRSEGNAKRGALLFHQVNIGCVKCHAVDGKTSRLGPDLLVSADHRTDAYVIESVLNPSARILKGYETLTVLTNDGKLHTGLKVKQSPQEVVLRDAVSGNRQTLPASQIEETAVGTVSIMPQGLANQLANRQQFLDLMKYVFEIQKGGLPVASRLQPSPGMYALRLPDYETKVDHAGLLNALDQKALQRGQKIYERLCMNCHGNKERPGSLPTALRFSEGTFRHGNDPYTMYKTLTHGFGFMVPQTWMVPQQKYDVIHYIRETFLRKDNVGQYADITDDYLASLPSGNTFGPEPVKYAPWSDMNYGPSMVNTFEVGDDGTNFAHKGIAVRLDRGPGGVSKGRAWVVFDHDTMRLAAAWVRPEDSTESGFINWQGIHFDGRHGVHPRIAGDLQFQNPTGPGWALPGTMSFVDDQRVLGRDKNRYGPLPKTWASYQGLHSIGDDSIVEYTIGDRKVLEQFNLLSLSDVFSSEQQTGDVPVFARTMSLGPSQKKHTMAVATHPDSDAQLRSLDPFSVLLATESQPAENSSAAGFDGSQFLQIDDSTTLNMTDKSFTIVADVKTTSGGTIFSQCPDKGDWVRNGKAFFIRDGRLVYDIGWVGEVRSKVKVDDGQSHQVAMTWDHQNGQVQFWIDGRKSGGGRIRPQNSNSADFVSKIGFANRNFPKPSKFQGEVSWCAFFDRTTSDIPANLDSARQQNPVAIWNLKAGLTNAVVGHRSQQGLVAKLVGKPAANPSRFGLLAGVIAADGDFQFQTAHGRLLLSCPPSSENKDVVVWTVRVPVDAEPAELNDLRNRIADRISADDLRDRIQTEGPARWPEVQTTIPRTLTSSDAFTVDQLTPPSSNPWLARLRLTGHDFLPDGDRVAVCSWDGDVWMVSGLSSLNDDVDSNSDHPSVLKWQRIASGLFQPLGLKVVDGSLYVTCRDQLVILRDRNKDGETDFYECFNNDHQVTPHFHEFAMGLQQDDAGNFYYAKSARHAKTAVVPHHGTLLRIPADGSRTDILATGFRAANGVCLNPDGTFIVTDQEGHWNPKNRINWVREGGFYGNMYGYHDVTDSSDTAMQQPLCWITNAFDRSPAELLWIDHESWGPLNGSLLNLSYGYGKVYVVPHENIGGQMQGGLCEFPIEQFPTGIHRGRLHPKDGGLYVCGLFAWASSQQQNEGGFYRIRPTGKPSYLPVGLQAKKNEIRITFSDQVLSATADVNHFKIQTWDLKRTKSYGSKHYNQQPLKVSHVSLEDDRRTIVLQSPDLKPTWGMEIACELQTDSGPVERVIHNSIHKLP